VYCGTVRVGIVIDRSIAAPGAADSIYSTAVGQLKIVLFELKTARFGSNDNS